MKTFVKNSIVSFIISTLTCGTEVLLMAVMTQDWGDDSLLSVACLGILALLSILLIIIVHIFYCLYHKNKKGVSLEQLLSIAVISDVMYVCLLKTLFPACCWYLGIGEDWAGGLLLGMTWYAIFAVAIVYLVVLICIVVYFARKRRVSNRPNQNRTA